MRQRWILILVVFWAIGLVTACGDSSLATAPSSQQQAEFVPETRVLPTLYPTASVLPIAPATNTRPPEPTVAPATEIPFEQLVVDVRYMIPTLGLDRRIQGNVAGTIEVIDENTGTSMVLRNRSGVILEMQQSLPRATLQTPDPACEACVFLAYDLPLSEQSGEGWLDDVQMLASLENYTALALGPHFPPDTIAGLRREATPYNVAHTAALTAEGRLWSWMATDSEIDAPAIAASGLDEVASELNAIDWQSVPDFWGQPCYEGGGRETLLLDSPDGVVWIELRCPELYLPAKLLPLYLILSEAAGERLADSDLAPPELPLALENLVVYRRDDGARLELSYDGRLSVMNSEGVTYTSIVTNSQVLSLTTALLDSGLLQVGLSAAMGEEPGNYIVLRSVDGVYEVAWIEVDSPLEEVIRPWDDLLESAMPPARESDETPEPEPAATENNGS